MSLPAFPVDAVIPEVRRALGQGKQVVLQAPPGAGKTTRVPPALLHEPWLSGKGMILLEPRRLAAKMCAVYMASQLGERLGQTVGYSMRLEHAVSRKTRIEVVTEGVLTRRLQEDPGLEGVGLILFDEFHERSIHADVGLAFTLDIQKHLRADLRILIMSATLEGERICSLFPQPQRIISHAPSFPVDIRYLTERKTMRAENALQTTVEKAIRVEEGDVLVFLPGEREIHRLQRWLQERYPHGLLRVTPLYGRLPFEQQQMALRPSPDHVRKVVLATPVAETSLTIEGIRVVVDSGLQRVSRTDPRTGLSRLETVRISQASATQRAGRAGRTAPGIGYRLWSESEQGRLKPYGTPEILTADPTALALELALWAVHKPEELSWLDAPDEDALRQSRELLCSLEAVDRQGKATDHGRRMARLGAHPRLAHMMLRAAEQGSGATACALAALLEERTVVPDPDGKEDADIRSRLECLEKENTIREDQGSLGGIVPFLSRTAKRWQAMLGISGEKIVLSDSGPVLALAYPERIAQRRPGSHTEYLLCNGRGAVLPGIGTLSGSEYLVIASLEGSGVNARIFLAAPYSLEDLYQQFHPQMSEERLVGWDGRSRAVTAERRLRLGHLVLRTVPLDDPDAEELRQAVLNGLRQDGLSLLPWDEASRGFLLRVNFLREFPGEKDSWPDMSDGVLKVELEQWLGPYLEGVRRAEDLQRLDLVAILENRLDRSQQQRLRELAPTHVVVPSGSRLRLVYRLEGPPVLAVRIQELFGLKETPTVARGRIPVLLQLLSPAGRPMQITRDLAGFWRSGYTTVRRELLGRYPRHPWPEDPLSAVPTRHAKKRGIRAND